MSASTPAHRGWHYRGYLPHFDGGPEQTQSVTFRLGDSLPAGYLPPPTNSPTDNREWRQRTEESLDRGLGACHLRRPEIAELVRSSLLFFDGERYALHEWVIMPNHVHTLFTPMLGHSMSKIVQGWKSCTCRDANRVLGTAGQFWEPDYFDRFIRDEDHFSRVAAYIVNNPVKAGLCQTPEGWPFSSATRRE